MSVVPHVFVSFEEGSLKELATFLSSLNEFPFPSRFVFGIILDIPGSLFIRIFLLELSGL